MKAVGPEAAEQWRQALHLRAPQGPLAMLPIPGSQGPRLQRAGLDSQSTSISALCNAPAINEGPLDVRDCVPFSIIV